jgi:DNA-binding NarL/FixJ family response regulator
MIDRLAPGRWDSPAADSSTTRNSKVIGVAIVDDHPLALIGLRALIDAASDFTVVAEASEIEAALAFVQETPPQVIVIDVPMPRLTMNNFARHCRDLRLKSKVIVNTAREDKIILSELLQSGAHGYLLKRSIPDELIRAMRIVLGGGSYIDPVIASRLLMGGSRDDGPPGATLSQRERAVLKLVARGLVSKEIAAEMVLSVKTIQTYKTRAMKKLHLRTRADVVRYGVACGWLDEF